MKARAPLQPLVAGLLVNAAATTGASETAAPNASFPVVHQGGDDGTFLNTAFKAFLNIFGRREPGHAKHHHGNRHYRHRRDRDVGHSLLRYGV